MAPLSGPQPGGQQHGSNRSISDHRRVMLQATRNLDYEGTSIVLMPRRLPKLSNQSGREVIDLTGDSDDDKESKKKSPSTDPVRSPNSTDKKAGEEDTPSTTTSLENNDLSPRPSVDSVSPPSSAQSSSPPNLGVPNPPAGKNQPSVPKSPPHPGLKGTIPPTDELAVTLSFPRTWTTEAVPAHPFAMPESVKEMRYEIEALHKLMLETPAERTDEFIEDPQWIPSTSLGLFFPSPHFPRFHSRCSY